MLEHASSAYILTDNAGSRVLFARTRFPRSFPAVKKGAVKLVTSG